MWPFKQPEPKELRTFVLKIIKYLHEFPETWEVTRIGREFHSVTLVLPKLMWKIRVSVDGSVELARKISNRDPDDFAATPVSLRNFEQRVIKDALEDFKHELIGFIINSAEMQVYCPADIDLKKSEDKLYAFKEEQSRRQLAWNESKKPKITWRQSECT